jgi:hypothetical protein
VTRRVVRRPHYHALAAESWCTPRIVHTGQHCDANMSDAFFADLGMPKSHVHLNVGSGGHGEQTGRVMIEYEKVCLASRPGWGHPGRGPCGQELKACARRGAGSGDSAHVPKPRRDANHRGQWFDRLVIATVCGS